MTSRPGSDAPSWVSRRLPALYLAGGLLIVSVFAQATLLARLRFFGASANLVLITAVCWSLLRGPEEGVPWAFLGGLAFDIVAGLPLGTSSLALMLVAAMAVLGEGNFFQGHVFLPMIAVSMATPVYAWLILLTEQLRGLVVDWPGMTVRVIVPELLLNLVLVALVYPVLRWLLARVGSGRMEW